MHLSEGRNDDKITNARPSCCRSVDGNHTAATFPPDGIGHKPFTVVDVPDMDLFVLEDIGCIKKVFIDGA